MISIGFTLAPSESSCLRKIKPAAIDRAGSPSSRPGTRMRASHSRLACSHHSAACALMSSKPLLRSLSRLDSPSPSAHRFEFYSFAATLPRTARTLATKPPCRWVRHGLICCSQLDRVNAANGCRPHLSTQLKHRPWKEVDAEPRDHGRRARRRPGKRSRPRGNPIACSKTWDCTEPELRAWAMYDWANSAMVTTIITAMFPIYYASVACKGVFDPDEATRRYATATVIGMVIIALLSPVLGTIADLKGDKKKMLGGFLALGVCLGGRDVLHLPGRLDPGLGSVHPGEHRGQRQLCLLRRPSAARCS